jgi:phospholipid/cholesterol/gamma-HCH transport system substrate-binding protein
MTSRKQRISPIVAGVIAGLVIALVVGVMAKINLDFAAPWARTHTMTAQVVDADGIGVSSDVRIAGRLVGQITGVHARGPYSDVVFHIDDQEWPLPKDSTASIRLATLLGQKYLELQPGSDIAACRSDKTLCYAENDVIPESKTKPVVDFDQILNGFDATTRSHLTALIRTVGSALQNQEGTLQNLLPDLRQLSADSQTGLSTLANENGHLDSILVNLGVAADQLNTSRNDLAGVIDNLNSVTGALASHQDALRGQIRNGDALNITTDQILGNGGAAELNAALHVVNATGHRLDQLLTTLIPQSLSFQTPYPNSTRRPLDNGVDLIYRIGDATSQSDADGYFLRQYAQGVDLIGLSNRPGGSGTSSSGTSNGASNGNGNGGHPTKPTGPQLPLPLPTLPSIPGLNGILPGGNGSSHSPSPSLPPLPSLPPFGSAGVLSSAGADSGGDASLAGLSLADFVFSVLGGASQ